MGFLVLYLGIFFYFVDYSIFVFWLVELALTLASAITIAINFNKISGLGGFRSGGAEERGSGGENN
jgi:hypothetical protein